MVSIEDLAATLQPLLTTTAEASGMMKRRGKVTEAAFVQALAVPATATVAPAPTAIAARIEEEPAAASARAFAGPDYARAVYDDEDRAYLRELAEFVEYFAVPAENHAAPSCHVKVPQHWGI
jgi:hypothetical protein